jgi:hypothetical protein
VPSTAGTARHGRDGPGAGKQATQARDSPHLGSIGHRLGGWGSLRRAAAADRWWRDRGHSNSDEDRRGAGQRVARVASLGPSGGVGMVGWLEVRAKSVARRWLPGGGRQDSGSSE